MFPRIESDQDVAEIALVSTTVVVALFEPKEEHLRTQIESILQQSHQVSEIIISDDSLSDRAGRIIQEIAFPKEIAVKYVKNTRRLGYTANFLSALRLASGEIVFFCDQDDFWLPGKVSLVLEVFEDNPNALLVVHDQIRTDSELVAEPLSTIESYMRKGWSSRNLVHGCASAFRSSIKEVLSECPNNFQYDEWLHFVGSSVNGRIVLPIPLMKFRRHPQAATIVDSRVTSGQAHVMAKAHAYLAWRHRENNRASFGLKLLAEFFRGGFHEVGSSMVRRRELLAVVERKLEIATAEANVLSGSFCKVLHGASRLAPECLRGTYDLRIFLKDLAARLLGPFS